MMCHTLKWVSLFPFLMIFEIMVYFIIDGVLGSIKCCMGNSLVVQWLGPNALTARGPGSIHGQGTKILQTARCSHKKKKMLYIRTTYSPCKLRLPAHSPKDILQSIAAVGTGITKSVPNTARERNDLGIQKLQHTREG